MTWRKGVKLTWTAYWTARYDYEEGKQGIQRLYAYGLLTKLKGRKGKGKKEGINSKLKNPSRDNLNLATVFAVGDGNLLKGAT